MTIMNRIRLKPSSSEKQKTEKDNSEQEDTFGKDMSEKGHFRR